MHAYLGHAVDCPWPLDGEVGRRVPGGVGPESADGRRDEHPQVVLLAQLHHVVQALDVHPLEKERMFFTSAGSVG